MNFLKLHKYILSDIYQIELTYEEFYGASSFFNGDTVKVLNKEIFTLPSLNIVSSAVCRARIDTSASTRLIFLIAL